MSHPFQTGRLEPPAVALGWALRDLDIDVHLTQPYGDADDLRLTFASPADRDRLIAVLKAAKR